MAVLLVIRRMSHTFGNRTELMYLLAQDCLEMRFNGFRKPDGRSAIKQGSPTSCSNRASTVVEREGEQRPRDEDG